MQTVSTLSAPAAIGPYSQAVVHGDLVFTSGSIAIPPNGSEIVGRTAAEQARLALANLKAVLEAAGSSMDRVLRCTVYLVDMGEFAEVNEVYAQAFGDSRPARSTVAVAALPKGARVEIDCIAAR